MGNKKKKKKSAVAQKKKLAEFQGLSGEELSVKGAAFLNAGKPRDAIPLLKAALKENAGNTSARGLLFEAYLLRAAHLRNKGMAIESETVLQNALALMPDPARMSEPELLQFIGAAAPEASIAACHNYLKTNKPSPLLEPILAGLLVMTGKWDLLKILPEDAGLLVDSVTAREAERMMNDGEWDAALETLKPIARNSPYAPARLLCLAMSCFYKEDEAGMKRALSMIPENHPLHFLATILSKDARQMACLWDRPVYSESDVATLMSHLKQNHAGKAATYIRKFSEAAYPDDPKSATREILLSLLPLTLCYELQYNSFMQLAKDLLTGPEANLVMAKFDYYHFEMTLSDTIAYLQVLEIEFPDAALRKKAAALILVHTVEKIETRGIRIHSVHHLPTPSRNLLGIHSHGQSLHLIEMTVKAIDLDPENRLAYDLLAKLPRNSSEAKSLVEKGLGKMLAVFPEDPFPCLELSELYYQKNAFRKAENILTEAKKRAPHDDRVTDRHVLALLISAGKRIRGNKLHLAAEDLEKAHALCNDRTMPLVTAKKVCFECEVSGQLSLFSGNVARSPKEWSNAVTAAIAHLTPYQRLQTLGFLAIDLTRHHQKSQGIYGRQLDKLFQQCRNDIPQLTANEIRNLLVPMEKTLQPVMPSLFRAGVYLKQYPTLLERVSGADMAPVLDALVAERLFVPLKKEIRRRLKPSDAPSAALMEFYLVVIRHMIGELQNDAEAFEKILQKVTPDEKELLRAAARRLSGYATGRLQEALSAFDFDLLKRPNSRFGGFGMLDWDEDDDDWDALDDELDDEMDAFPDFLADMLSGNKANMPEFIKNEAKAMISVVEGIMDKYGLRGAPGHIIRDFRDEMKKSAPGPWVFDIVSLLLTDSQIKKLSREAREFIFGKN